MKYSDFLWDEFVYGGHWLSLGAPAIALSVITLLHLSIRWEFLLIVYLGTQCIYNYNHYKEFHIDTLLDSDATRHLEKCIKFYPFITVVYGVSFFILLFLGSVEGIFFGGFLLLLGLLYTIGGKKLSKRLVGFKSFYIAFSWALLVPFTAIYYRYSIDIFVFLLFLFVFLRFIVDTIFYDIKDLQSDTKEKILTFPVLLGKTKCLNLLQILNFLPFIPLIAGIFLQIFPSFSFFLMFTFFYSFYYIQRARNETADIRSLTYILVDGEYYFWPFLLFLGLLFPFR